MAPPLLAALRTATAPDRVLGRDIERVAWASDASMYHLVPRAVVFPADGREVAAVLQVARRFRVPVTFRAAGTSLSGQAVTDGILVEVARHWKGATVLDGGRAIRARPGMIGAHLNALLAPHGTRLGPDPSSIDACTLGGILANNSSGLCSGVAQNSYHTLRSLTLLLPSGTRLDTGRADADDELRAREPALHTGLLALRQELLANAPLAERVRARHRRKNTTGYGLNALLDHERPAEILAHLFIGAEGTLGFIEEAVLETVPLLPHTATGFLQFPSVQAACASLEAFRAAGAEMLELLDGPSVRTVAPLPGVPREAAALPREGAALLVQLRSADAPALAEREAALRALLRALPLAAPALLTRDAATQAALIHARKGLYPAVGGRRAAGTSLLLEDVAVPVERLAEAAVDLQGLFARHGYDDAVLFGHARDGNLHFLLTQPVDATGVDRYARFMDELVPLIAGRHDGALKAEHGTGRNMAPFVGAEWGPEAVALMRRVKALCDPDGVLSPGVLLTDDARGHLKHLKTVPLADAETDRCVECGFCEPVCPSRTVTLTPRQRIVVRREAARRRAAGDAAGAHALDLAFTYPGVDTCATDGLCGRACPVGIDTGRLVTRLRAESHGPLTRGLAQAAGEHWGAVTGLARAGLRLGAPLAALAARALPGAGRRAPRPARTSADAAVYFPSCMGRVLDDADDPLLVLARRAGVSLRVPAGLDGMCCGLAFASKGYPGPARARTEALQAALAPLTDGGLPVVVDGSSCAHHLHGLVGTIAVEDAVRFTHRTLLPRLTVRRRIPVLALHIPCAAQHLGLEGDLRALAAAVAERVVEPARQECCGFAGDRGFTHPELTAGATAAMAESLRGTGAAAGAGSNLPCGVGMTRATGLPFRPILALLEEATR